MVRSGSSLRTSRGVWELSSVGLYRSDRCSIVRTYCTLLNDFVVASNNKNEKRKRGWDDNRVLTLLLWYQQQQQQQQQRYYSVVAVGTTVIFPMTIPYPIRYQPIQHYFLSISTNQQHHDKTSITNNDNAKNWREWFHPRIVYQNPWEGSMDHNNKNNRSDRTSSSSFWDPLDDRDRYLDYSTRYIIQLLQDLYLGRFGISNSVIDDNDSWNNNIMNNTTTLSTDRCNSLLQQLLNAISSTSFKNTTGSDDNGSTNIRRNQLLTKRADAIVQLMDLLYQKYQPRHPRSLLFTDSTAGMSLLPSTQQHQQYERLPFVLPQPNRLTYNILLQMSSKTSSGKDPLIALYPSGTKQSSSRQTTTTSRNSRTEFASSSNPIIYRGYELIRCMEDRYHHGNELDLKPNSFHWNCLLLSYKEQVRNTNDYETKRQLLHEAVTLFLSLAQRQQNEEQVGQQNINKHEETSSSAIVNIESSYIDASSFIHILHICQQVTQQSSSSSSSAKILSQQHQQQLQLLGTAIAVKVWDEIIDKEPSLLITAALTSHFYSHFLQVIRYLPIQDTKNTATSAKNTASQLILSTRSNYYIKCFKRACHCGKVNHYVLKELIIHAKNGTVLEECLGGPDYKKYIGLSRSQKPTTNGMAASGSTNAKATSTTPDEIVQNLFDRYLPSEWYKNAD